MALLRFLSPRASVSLDGVGVWSCSVALIQAVKTKPTVASLAKSLGVSRQRLEQHLDKPNAPALDNVAAWKKFLIIKGDKNIPLEKQEELADKILCLKAEQARVWKVRADEAEGKTIDIELVHKTCARAMSALFAGLEYMIADLPPKLKGLEAIEIHGKLEAAVRKMQSDFKTELEEMVK